MVLSLGSPSGTRVAQDGVRHGHDFMSCDGWGSWRQLAPPRLGNTLTIVMEIRSILR